MTQLTAIIGGTGFTEYPELKITQQQIIETELGHTSAPVIFAELSGQPVVFLARHGHPHKLPPHKVNYRANMLALQSVGVTEVIAINAVGGITHEMDSEVLCIPHQIIDYTHGREDTFFDGVFKPLDQIDFRHRYDTHLRARLLKAAQQADVAAINGGVYGATQGPRLETIAEVIRLERDGCDVVGMTGMPEAALARELNIPYASVSLVVNKAAGKSDDLITMDDIRQSLVGGMNKVKRLLAVYVSNLG